MYKEKINALIEQRDGKQAQAEALATEIRALLPEDGEPTDEDTKTASEKTKTLEDINKELKSLTDDIDLYQKAAKGAEKPAQPAVDPEKLEDNERELATSAEVRDAYNAFIVSKNAEIRDTVVSDDMGAVIPTSIVTKAVHEVKTVVDLSTLATSTKVKTAAGSYPILKRATTGFHTVEELVKNPELAKPVFENINWKVATYRGSIPVSQESIDDADDNVIQIVANNIVEQKVNTLNGAIAPVLKGFTAVTATVETLVDELKAVLNVKLDPAYQPVIVASSSFYNTVDTLKDANSQYVLHQDITGKSDGTLLGVKVVRVNDELLGAAGESNAFVGDMKRAVLFADRSDISVRWVDNDIYGQRLMGAFRFDVKPADAAAGFFVTAKASK